MAGLRAFRACACHKTVDPFGRLLPDLRSGRFVCPWSFRCVELVDVKTVARSRNLLRGRGCGRHICAGDAAGTAILLRHQHDVGSERLQHARTLRTVACRHRHHQRVAERRAHDREARAHVPGGHLHHHATRSQAAILAR
jgi:hypothetical protein